MSGASDILDPVEAAQDDISRSKRLIVSTLDDLTRHHSWLESYHRDERRRAQRLRRQEILRQLERRRQRAAWMARRFALRSLAVTRATATFLARNGAAFLAWAAPRAHALTLLVARELSAATALSWRTGRDLAQISYEGAVTGFAWSVRMSDMLGIAFRQWLSAEAAALSAEIAVLSTEAAIRAEPMRKRAAKTRLRLRFRSQRLASVLQAHASDGWTQARSKAPVLAAAASMGWARFADEAMAANVRLRDQLATAFEWTRGHTQDAFTAASMGWARLAGKALDTTTRGREQLVTAFEWTRTHTQEAATTGFRTALQTWSQAATRTRRLLESRDPPQRALVVRRCTALVCTQPWRARLPVVRAD